jgi:uncharacterized protein YndB with AHSA1/START domain
MEAPSTTHATLHFERTIPATTERVFAAYTDLRERMQWGAPSEGTALIYERSNFAEGGEDVFRCGPKSNPNIEGSTRYLDIVPSSRIVSSETIAMDGHRLCASLSTLEFRADGNQTILKATIQLASFVGQDMVRGHENGTNASLDNLVSYLQSQKVD